MKFALGLILVGMTVGTLWAGRLQPIAPEGGFDRIEPIGPVTDTNSADLQAHPALTAAAVPEPSTISLIAGSAVVGSWFCLRRRRRQ